MRRTESPMATALLVTLLVIGAVASAGRSESGQLDPRRAPSFAEKLQIVVPQFEADGTPMADLAVQMAYNYKLPMAIENVDSDALHKPLHLKLKGQTVRQVLAAVVGSLPGYMLDCSQGMADVYSPTARRDPSNPFNTVINRYDVEGVDTHFAGAQLLCDIGRQLHGHSGCGGSIASGQWGDITITLHLRGKHVYEILNAIVAQNGEALWTPITPPKVSTTLITGNFWYIYPLDPPFEKSAIGRLQELLSRQR
jgi:hypothetical protein